MNGVAADPSTATFVILEAGPEEADDPVPVVPDPTTPSITVNLEVVPGRFSTFAVPLTEDMLRDLVEVAFACGGSATVTAVIDSVRQRVPQERAPQPTRPPPSSLPWVFRPIPRVDHPPVPLSEPQRERADLLAKALGVLTDAETSLRERMVDALADVDDAVRRVFLELLADTRVKCALARCGLVEDVVDPQTGSRALVSPPVDVAHDGEVRFWALREAVVELDGLARGVRAADEAVTPWAGPSMATAAEPLAQRIEAQALFVAAWQRWVLQFPVLAVVARDVLKATGDREQRDLLEDLKGRGAYTNELDTLLRTAVVGALRDAWAAGPDLAEEVSAAANTCREMASHLDRDAEVIYGERHPLFRYPLLVWTALERIGAGPDSMEYAAAASALAIAADVAAKEAVAAEEAESILGWAQVGFGVAAMIPVVGEAVALAGALLAAGRVIATVVDYRTQRARRAAFGIHADRLSLPDPDGLGVILKAVSLSADMLPLLGLPAKLAGKWLRVTALAGRLSGAEKAVHTGAHFLPQVQETIAYLLGIEIERRAAIPIPVP